MGCVVPRKKVNKRVLSLDLGRRTGWALGSAGVAHESGVLEIYTEKDKISDGQKFLRLWNWISSQRQFFDEIVFEQVGGGTKGRQTVLYNGYRGTLVLYGEQHSVKVTPYAVGTIKKAVTGTGKGRKDGVMRAIRERGYSFFDDNEADAIAALLTHHACSVDKSLLPREDARTKQEKPNEAPSRNSTRRKSRKRKNNVGNVPVRRVRVPKDTVREAPARNVASAGSAGESPQLHKRKRKTDSVARRKKRTPAPADAGHGVGTELGL